MATGAELSDADLESRPCWFAREGPQAGRARVEGPEPRVLPRPPPPGVHQPLPGLILLCVSSGLDCVTLDCSLRPVLIRGHRLWSHSLWLTSLQGHQPLLPSRSPLPWLHFIVTSSSLWELRPHPPHPVGWNRRAASRVPLCDPCPPRSGLAARPVVVPGDLSLLHLCPLPGHSTSRPPCRLSGLSSAWSSEPIF